MSTSTRLLRGRDVVVTGRRRSCRQHVLVSSRRVPETSFHIRRDVLSRSTIVVLSRAPDQRTGVMRARGCRILPAGSADEVHAHVQRERVDLIVADVDLTNNQRVELLRNLRLTCTAPILFMEESTSFALETVLDDGAATCMARSQNPYLVAARCAAILRGGGQTTTVGRNG